MLILIRKKNYLAMIENSVIRPTALFQNVYAEINNEEKDIVEGGRKSCAFYSSVILYVNKLCFDIHTGIDGLEKDIIAFGWQAIQEIKNGAIIIWASQKRSDGTFGRHSGFAVSQNEAISNGSNGGGVPIRHHITYGINSDGSPMCKIEKIYWHPNLDKETW